MTLDHETLRRLLDYDPATGIFRWRVPRKKCVVGGQAGTQSGDKRYWCIGVSRRTYSAHRLAHFYMTGTWPPKGMDHKDGNGLNNAWNNLRLSDQSQNGANRGKPKNNTTGAKGVFKCRHHYAAQICVQGKKRHLGVFDSVREVHEAYRQAAEKAFGEFARVA